MGSRLAIIVMVVMLVPMLTPSELSPIGITSAATNCDGGDFVTPKWNNTVERLAKVPDIKDEENEYEEEKRRGKDKDRDNDDDDETIEYYGPEEDWMSLDPNNELILLKDDFQTTMLIGEDAVGTLRVNLDHQRRTTVCVTIIEYSNDLKSEVIHSGNYNSSLDLDDGVYCLEAWVDESQREISCIDVGDNKNSHDNDDLTNNVDGIEILFEENSSLNFTIDTTLEGNVTWELVEYSNEDPSSASADVYLLTTSQYDRYTAAYDVNHGAWGGRGYEADLSEIPPEWRSFNVAGWQTFRDSHQYENVEEVSFSVSLDGPEISTGLFGGDSLQYFNIVIDNTNNSHSGDALPDGMIAAYVSVVSEERSTILPNWTVSLLCCGMMMGVLVVPIIMNKKYMSAGLSLTAENQQLEKGLVPSLEQKDVN